MIHAINRLTTIPTTHTTVKAKANKCSLAVFFSSSLIVLFRSFILFWGFKNPVDEIYTSAYDAGSDEES